MKKVWVLEQKNNDTWNGIEGSTNYFRFTSSIKKILKQTDDEAVKILDSELENSPWTEEIKEKYKQLHKEIKSTFRVLSSSISDDSKDWKQYDKETIQVNDGVLNYVWNTRNYEKKEKK